MKCKSIDEVILVLTQIIEECKISKDPLGYFAVIYKKVTVRIQQGILQKEFEDNARMEQLDIFFANRYFEAYFAYKQKSTCSQCWKTAFEAGQENGHIILQHILLGINAHINLDLGIAAFETMNGKTIHGIQKDFYAVNDILAKMVDDVKTKMAKVSPVFNWLMPLVSGLDEMLINFSIKTARDGAWDFAICLSQQQSIDQVRIERDSVISMLGRKLRNPGIRLNMINRIIALFEWRSVKENITILDQ